MKLILQIALGVMIGTLTSQLVIDRWHVNQNSQAKLIAEKERAEQHKARMEEGKRIRNLILQSRQGNLPESKRLPDEFIPDDAQSPLNH